MNTNRLNQRIDQTEIYWENTAIRTFPIEYRYDVSESDRVLSLAEIERQRFQVISLRSEFDISKCQRSFKSLAAILFGSLMTGLVGCSSEDATDHIVDATPAAHIAALDVADLEPAPASSTFGADLRVTNGNSVPLPPAMEY